MNNYKPQHDEVFYYIVKNGNKYQVASRRYYDFSYVSKMLVKHGNCYPTQAEAEKQIKDDNFF